MSENEKIVMELSRKSARSAVKMAISSLETPNYLVARATGDLSLVHTLKLGGPEADQMKKSLGELQTHMANIKKLQESLLDTLNGLKLLATST